VILTENESNPAKCASVAHLKLNARTVRLVWTNRKHVMIQDNKQQSKALSLVILLITKVSQ